MRRRRVVVMAACMPTMVRVAAVVMMVTAMVVMFRMMLVMRASFVLAMLRTVRDYFLFVMRHYNRGGLFDELRLDNRWQTTVQRGPNKTIHVHLRLFDGQRPGKRVEMIACHADEREPSCHR